VDAERYDVPRHDLNLLGITDLATGKPQDI
jgi:hypothetical protein